MNEDLLIAILGRIKLTSKFEMFEEKKSFISGHIIRLRKYFRALNTISSYSGSDTAFAHNYQIYEENPFIDYYTSSLYLLA